MNKIKTFRDLNVYERSHTLAMEIFRLTSKFPSEEKYSLTDQIRRSSRSIAVNIADGWGKRTFVNVFKRHLIDSIGSLEETKSWLLFAFECNYISQERYDYFIESYEILGRQLYKLHENWQSQESLATKSTFAKAALLLFFLTSYLLLLTSQSSLGQNPVPAKPQSKTIILVGGVAHLGNGQVIQNSIIAFDKGVITAIGDASTNVNRTNAEVIDITGKHVYPGLISANNHVGLAEIESVPATNDYTEINNINPNVRALIAYNADSEIIPTVRGNGVLISQAVPEGGMITGQSSIFEMEGWNWQDAVLKTDDGVWLNWPTFISRELNFETFSIQNVRNTRRDVALRELEKTFKDAIAYAEGKGNTTNLKMEAMKGLFDGSKTMFVRADYSKQIIEAVQFAKAHKVKKIVIAGASEALAVADFLKENNVPVILGGVHELPARNDEDVDMPYKLPSLLHKAGIQTAISYGGLSWRTRNLAFLAGTAAGFGLDKEEALKMITSNVAKILGIDSKVGTIETGKLATLVVSKGDLLDMRTSIVEMAFIQGKKIDLDDKQKRLYRKFSEKYQK